MSVTYPQGFLASGVAAGLKSTGKPDVALVVNTGPRDDAAAVFTSNRVYAAPVAYSRQSMADGHTRAVVLNSGGANACTGRGGYDDVLTTADVVARAVDVEPSQVAVCSTGLIGVRLPMDKLLPGVHDAADALAADGGDAAAHAIMTTDSVPKLASLQAYDASGERPTWRIGGMAKGAGMLAPGLATMLVVLTTDAVLDAEQLDASLKAATRVTFDRVDSDGCMSTNDTVILMASGASEQVPDPEEFAAALTEVCRDLAEQLITDAEGASHDIAVRVVGAASEDDALEIARSIARNNLFKAAVFGNDPNWGRVLAAIGTTSAAFDPNALDVSFNGVMVSRGGGIGEDRSLCDLTPRQTKVLVDLHAGAHEATILTNDLTYDYVKENAEYSS